MPLGSTAERARRGPGNSDYLADKGAASAAPFLFLSGKAFKRAQNGRGGGIISDASLSAIRILFTNFGI